MTEQSSLDSSYEEDAQKDKYLTFSLGNELYGIEIKHVIEIIGIQTITVVPELPEYVRGIINLRGKIIPAMDVRLRFKKTFREYNDRTCIVVIDIQEISVGLIVDSVSEVLSIPGSDIVPPPEAGGGMNRYIQGIGKLGAAVMLLLDCDKMLNDNEIDKLFIAQ
ncbi:chemotaxis protein CheW [Bacillus sp. FJAT-26390]|uniref:chemotaxis protein CheW n=2 Tax=Bacillales TaxID=1385 RepID=UPI0006A77CA2|nr:chemotaxis protein CheW [Bacillus sp. FJAT-26390]OBZ07805.1 chemotaxis protein CheW [Bacillus sp. FJAT-26390]